MATVTTSKALVMEFANDAGKKRALRIHNPRENVTAQEISGVMTLITTLNAFRKLSDDGSATAKGAKIVETTTTSFDMNS